MVPCQPVLPLDSDFIGEFEFADYGLFVTHVRYRIRSWHLAGVTRQSDDVGLPG
jgi:hypothetical protein